MREMKVVTPKQIRVVETTNPIIRNGQAIIDVKYCGVCGSELHVFEGTHPKVKPPTQFPLGHEATGVVSDVSENSEGIHIGDRVAIVPLVGCQNCVYCADGKANLCVDRHVIGFQLPGCFADQVSVPVGNMVLLPKECSLQDGALLEPMAVVVHSVRLLDKVKYQSHQVIVTGAGMIGLSIALYLRYTHKFDIHIIEINEKRKKMAQDLGFKVHTDIGEALSSKNHIVVFECTGNKKVLDSIVENDPAPEMLIILGTFDRTEDINIFELCKREMLVVGNQMYNKEDIKQAAQLMATDFKNELQKIVSDRIYSLEEMQEAFEAAIQGDSGAKILVKI
jgi:threonine dehydrogenase-like Zn-dependent dehydrogenase